MRRKYLKPLPEILPETREYWEAAKRHDLLLQKCMDCGQIIYFPRFICFKCLSENLGWFKASGYGIIYSYTIIRQPAHQSFEQDVPYVYAIIEVDEGSRMISNIVNIDPEKVKIGMKVKVIFEDVSREISIPKFEPI